MLAASSPPWATSCSLSRRRCSTAATLFILGECGVYIKSLLWLIFAGNMHRISLSRSLFRSARPHWQLLWQVFGTRADKFQFHVPSFPLVCPGIQMWLGLSLPSLPLLRPMPPPMHKAFKCLGVGAAYAVSVSICALSSPYSPSAFVVIYICESQLIAMEKSSLVFGHWSSDCEKMSPNFPLSLIN